VLYALGIEIPDYNHAGFTSQVPNGIFENFNGSYKMPEIIQPPVQKITPAFDSEEGIYDLFGDRLKLYMSFDNSLEDETGKCTVSQCGNVKFYSNGVMSDAAEFGATGSFIVDNLDISKSFSLAFWLLADADLSGCICVIGNKSLETEHYQENGFDIVLRNHSVMVQLGCGDDDTDSVTSFGADVFRGWIHIAVSFDYENIVLRTFVNFGPAHIDSADKRFFEGVSKGGELIIGDDSGTGYNKNRGLIFRMDDLLCIDGVLDESDIDKLKKYYS
jgi:hypothetical protein